MALAFPEQREAHGFDTQYMFGPDLLVAPVLEPGGAVTVWLPEGGWRDWHTDRLHAGPKRLELRLPLDRFPLFLREGAILALAQPADRVAAWDGRPIPVTPRSRA